MLANKPKFLLAAMAIVLLVAGCGGGSDSTSSLTKAEFIKQADVICEKTDEAVVAAMKQGTKPGVGNEGLTPKQEKTLALVALQLVRKEANELAELGAPSGDVGEINSIVEGIETAVSESEKGPIHSLGSSFADVNKMAARYGFKACSEPL